MPDSRENSEWINALRSTGPSQEAALADLREILASGLRRGLSKWLEAYSPELEALAQEATQEALLRILDRLETFEGRSKFTTWAYKVAINIALTDLRRKQWQDLSLDEILDPQSGDHPGKSLVDENISPEQTVEQQELLGRLGEILQEELTSRQLSLMKAVALRGVPMEAVAQKMGVKRNALYKMMHDARLKLKRRMALEGFDLDEVITTFEEGNSTGGRVV